MLSKVTRSVFKIGISLVPFGIGTEVDESTIKHVIIGVGLIQNIVGIVVNIFHGNTMEHGLSFV